jgi:SpoVK/Ycf46/Vps4 family AAA+-type ATPase
MKALKSVTGNDRDNTANDGSGDGELAQFDKAIIEKIEADIIHNGSPVYFDDIAGLEFAKKCCNELICWPMTRPDLFCGLRALPRGLLLFGPPGTGKTLIGKAIAHQAGATFFSISASSLTSKWIGEGERTVRALFALAAAREPSVVFLDEVDSLLCQRSSDENEASRRMKTEFLVQLDGAGTKQEARVVVIGATNRPDELDEAARRRFVKRIYVPLPDKAGRKQLFVTLLRDTHHSMGDDEIDDLVVSTDGYSGADIRSLSTEAAMGPLREVASSRSGNLHSIRANDVPPISKRHFDEAFDSVAPSVSTSDLKRYIDWNATFGSFRRME